MMSDFPYQMARSGAYIGNPHSGGPVLDCQRHGQLVVTADDTILVNDSI